MRLVFPVRDIHGRLTGLMGRAIFEDQNGPTWYAYPGFQKGRYLYGENWVFPGSGRIILVEGQFDVIRCDINGIVNSVALMGSAFTEFHERTVLNWGLPVYWFLDGDESGQKARLKAIEQLRGKLPQYVAKCPDGKDPDNLDPAEMKAVLDAAEFVI
jgi:DNA primase